LSIGNLTYFLNNVQGSLVSTATNVNDIKAIIDYPNNYSYGYIFETDYSQDNQYFVSLKPSVTCNNGNTYVTNLKFSVFYTISGDFTCDQGTLENPLCKIITVCDTDHKENCVKYFDMYRLHCQNNLSEDFCFNFVQNYYEVMNGPQAQMDDLISSYCSNKEASQIFNKTQGLTEDEQRDFMLCGCHMKRSFYDNFYNSVTQYAESNGYEINESLFGQKEICLFPPCTVASASFPTQGVGKCQNNVCFNIAIYEDDGTVKNGGNIKIIQDSKCFVKNSVSALIPKANFSEKPSQGSYTIIPLDILLFIAIVVVVFCFICLLKLNKRYNKRKVLTGTKSHKKSYYSTEFKKNLK
jgi:hypothetical protein